MLRFVIPDDLIEAEFIMILLFHLTYLSSWFDYWQLLELIQQGRLYGGVSTYSLQIYQMGIVLKDGSVRLLHVVLLHSSLS